MTTLLDLFDLPAGELDSTLRRYLSEGLLRQVHHKNEPLAILNYTEKTAYAKHWDKVTLNCRGLIYNSYTLEVIARPFPKFFNHNEENAPKFDLSEKVIVTDKADGSLGILYREPSTGLAAIATRGSFYSDQAMHATRILRSRYLDWVSIYETIPQNEVQVSLMFEIVYPENRIVLDYGGTDDLFLLGGVMVPSGDIINPNMARVIYGWRGPKAYTFGFMTFGEALAMPPRESAEGVVIRSADDNRMVKFKQADYVHLHRIITGLNARSVWQWMADHDYDTDGLKESLPEEFWPWVDTVAAYLLEEEEIMWCAIENEYFNRIKVGGDRGQQARAFQGYEHAWALFAYLDEDYARVHAGIWKRIKPEADWSPYAGKQA